MSQIWAHTQRRAVLSGLKLPSGETATSDDAVCEGLHSTGGKPFCGSRLTRLLRANSRTVFL